MLSRKTRIGALIASCAVAAFLAIPAVGQALWCDDRAVHQDGGDTAVTAYANPSGSAQAVELVYYSDGPAVDGPSEIVIPAGEYAADFNVSVGAGYSGETVWVGMFGPDSEGWCCIWLE
jgi:hypothetical protein